MGLDSKKIQEHSRKLNVCKKKKNQHKMLSLATFFNMEATNNAKKRPKQTKTTRYMCANAH